MNSILLLLIVPLGAASIQAVLRGSGARTLFFRVSAALIALISVICAVQYTGRGVVSYTVEYRWLDTLMLGIELCIPLYCLARCRTAPRGYWWVPTIVALQPLIRGFTLLSASKPTVERHIVIDSFAVIMVLIIGIIGSLICIYAGRYMEEYHHHHAEVKDRRPFFFFTLFLFLTAMFGIVLSNSLEWLFLFWEITTVCSFEMIGYSRTEEAVRNSFRALGLNSLGGLAFGGALLYLIRYSSHPTLELGEMIASGAGVALVPAVLLSFAGLTKSAQMPFSSWLLGAMVAPTPVSALLHSSTMVKAGVFIIIKLSPVLQGTVPGKLIAFVGGLTFLVTSLCAVVQRNSKRVLAYSTIANLGLVVMCAGVGTATAVLAAMLLVVYHAVAKALLFLTVGTIEHQIGSRDIEEMDGLMVSHPLLGVGLITGILGMFLAPFGMLVSKWICLEALVQSNVLYVLLLAFGSAPTLFFWSKWLGKIIASPLVAPEKQIGFSSDEKCALAALSVGTLALCGLFPLLESRFILPYLKQYYPPVTIDPSNTATIFLMLGAMAVILATFLFAPRHRGTAVGPYLSGLTLEDGSGMFDGPMGSSRKLTIRSYYLSDFFNEVKLMRLGVVSTLLVFVILVGFYIL